MVRWTVGVDVGDQGKEGELVNEETEVITRFYDAFARRDAEAMVACYHSEVVFEDPAFGQLHGDQAKDMWRMLCRQGKDLKVVASNVKGANGAGSAHWEADYTFATKRKVHNVIDASFVFSGGLIFRHTDDFDFIAWSAQAFGPVGGLLARTPILPFAMRKLARRQLAQYSAHHRQ